MKTETTQHISECACFMGVINMRAEIAMRAEIVLN